MFQTEKCLLSEPFSRFWIKKTQMDFIPSYQIQRLCMNDILENVLINVRTDLLSNVGFLEFEFFDTG